MQLESGEELGEQGVVVELPLQSGSVLSLDVHRFERRDGGMALRAFVTCSDHALHLISSAGNILKGGTIYMVVRLHNFFSSSSLPDFFFFSFFLFHIFYLPYSYSFYSLVSHLLT